MKVTQDKGFNPITITLETREEALALRDFFGRSSREKRIKISGITVQQDNILVNMWDVLDDLL